MEARRLTGGTLESMNGFPGIGSGCVRLDGGLPQRNESALLVGQQNQTFRQEIDGGYLWSPSETRTVIVIHSTNSCAKSLRDIVFSSAIPGLQRSA